MFYLWLADDTAIAAAAAAAISDGTPPPVRKKKGVRRPRLSAEEQAFEMLVEGSPLKNAIKIAARTERRHVQGLADDLVEKLSEASTPIAGAALKRIKKRASRVIEGDTMFQGTPYHMTAAIASVDPIKLARAKAAPACWHRADNALMAGISLKKTANHFTMPEDLHDAILDLLEQRDMGEIGEQAADPEAEEGGEGDGGD